MYMYQKGMHGSRSLSPLWFTVHYVKISVLLAVNYPAVNSFAKYLYNTGVEKSDRHKRYGEIPTRRHGIVNLAL